MFFRNFYGATTFIEKSAIPKKYGFLSKNIKNQKPQLKKLNIATLLPLENIAKIYRQEKFGDSVTDEYLQETLKRINKKLHKD